MSSKNFGFLSFFKGIELLSKNYHVQNSLRYFSQDLDLKKLQSVHNDGSTLIFDSRINNTMKIVLGSKNFAVVLNFDLF